MENKMKKSELKRIIREEIKNILEIDKLDNFKTSGEVLNRISAIIDAGGRPPAALEKKYWELKKLGK